LSNSFFSKASAAKARIVVKPCSDALRWEKTGLRAANKLKYEFQKNSTFENSENLNIRWQNTSYDYSSRDDKVLLLHSKVNY
jgi:hypothetical protein